MSEVTIYTRQTCFYCVSAKRLLNELGVPFQEIQVDRNPEKFQEMQERSSRRTVPQIWIGKTHVGGCDELYALEESGGLRALLEQS